MLRPPRSSPPSPSPPLSRPRPPATPAAPASTSPSARAPTTGTRSTRSPRRSSLRLHVEEQLSRGVALIDARPARGDQDVEHVQRPQMRAHKASVSRTSVDKPGGQPASTTKPTIESVDGSLADEVEVPCITLAAGDRHDEVLSRGREDVVMLALAVHFSVEGQAGRQALYAQLH